MATAEAEPVALVVDADLVERVKAKLGMTIEVAQLDVTKIHPNPWNPNQQSEKVAQAERESIAAFGFVDPVTVRPHPEIEGEWQIIDGEHRWKEAAPLGFTEIPAVVLDVDDAQAKKLTVVLNETRGDADVVLLGQLLLDMQSLGEDFAVALPYTSTELEHLLSLGRENWDDFANAQPPDDDTQRPDVFEITLVFGDRVRHAEFKEWVELLQAKYETAEDDVTGTVAEAVRREVENL
jgi:hypothetical protein